MRRLRALLILLLLAVLLIGPAAGLLLRRLSSTEVAAQVATTLEHAYGAPVHIGRVRVGLGDSSLHGLALFEAGSEGHAAPWLSVDELDADLSAWELAHGAVHPRLLVVRGADVLLRFDRNGHLLTQLPHPATRTASLPDMLVHRGRVTLRQEGHPDLVVANVDARVQFADGWIVLTGRAADEHWGTWDLNGQFDLATNAISATLSTELVHVTEEMLRDLPFVSANTWRQFQAEGDTPVELTLSGAPGTSSVHYRVALQPEHTRAHVAAIDLHAEQARGTVIIEDGVVRLEDVAGRTAEGVIQTNGTLDFRSQPNRLTFDIQVQGLDLRRLPQKWHLPSQVEGRLTGEAKLVVLVRDGQVRTSGDGSGEITQARFVGLKAKPFRLRLHADGEGLHFTSQKPGLEQSTNAATSGAARN